MHTEQGKRLGRQVFRTCGASCRIAAKNRNRASERALDRSGNSNSLKPHLGVSTGLLPARPTQLDQAPGARSIAGQDIGWMEPRH